MSQVIEYQRGNYRISTDKRTLDIALIHDYLSKQSYWAQGRSLDIVLKSIENSLCFGVYLSKEQVGFARVVTDYATFSWICDLFILESQRGHNLGKWLVETVVNHAEIQDLKLSILATRDAHELYRRYGGFQSLSVPEKWMVRRKDER